MRYFLKDNCNVWNESDYFFLSNVNDFQSLNSSVRVTHRKTGRDTRDSVAHIGGSAWDDDDVFDDVVALNDYVWSWDDDVVALNDYGWSWDDDVVIFKMIMDEVEQMMSLLWWWCNHMRWKNGQHRKGERHNILMSLNDKTKVCLKQ